jgi:hypothetical protein
MNYIKLDVESHVYTKGDIIYTSVSKVISSLHKKFEDEEHIWLFYKSLQYNSKIHPDKIKKFDKELNQLVGPKFFSPERYNKLVSYFFNYKHKIDIVKSYMSSYEVQVVNDFIPFIKASWKKENLRSTTDGTAEHLKREEKSYADGYRFHRGEKFKVINQEHYDLSNLPEGIIPELIIHNDEFKVAGTSDLVIVHPNRVISISDYKTNKVLESVNKYGDKMFEPLLHLHDCNISHYTVQLSLYAWMLQQYGYTIKDLSLLHVKKDQEDFLFNLDYLENEAEAVMHNHKRKMSERKILTPIQL